VERFSNQWLEDVGDPDPGQREVARIGRVGDEDCAAGLDRDDPAAVVELPVVDAAGADEAEADAIVAVETGEVLWRRALRRKRAKRRRSPGTAE